MASAKVKFAGNPITEGVIWQQLLLFFFPILLGSFFQQMYNTVDAVIVGNFVGKEALAAVGGTTSALINLLVGFFVGLSSGATVVLSQHYGASRNKEVSQTVSTAFALAITGGLILTIFGIIFAEDLLRMMNTPDDVMVHATAYLRIYFVGVIPAFIYNIGTGILRAIGDSRRPLYFLMIACVVNIALDLLFVVVMKMGVKGVGYATVIAQCVSATLVIITLTRSNTSYQLIIKKIRFHGNLMRDIVRIGFPAGMQSMMYAISNAIVQSTVNGFGTDTVAAWTAMSKLDGMHWMMLQAFGIAVTTFVAQNIGARKYDRARKSVRTCLGLTTIFTLAITAIMVFFGGSLLRLFTNDETVLKYGVKIILQMSPYYILYICVEILSGALRGSGDTLVPLLMTVVGICGMRIVWIYLVLPHYNTLSTLTMCYPITWAITSLLFICYYLRGKWFERAVSKLA